MTWVKLDDGWPNNHKVEPLTDKAKLLYICSLCYCGRNLTDGVLNKKATGIVLAESGASRRHVVELHEAELWDRLEDGYLVHDFLEHNPTAEEVRRRRDTLNRGKKLFRDGTLRRLIKERDGDHCRYCRRVVNWADRKGPGGATYDHVDPYGDNAVGNIVVCCRTCNSAKGQRTPDEAGMTLYPPPDLGRSTPRNESDLGQIKSGLQHPSRPVKDQEPLSRSLDFEAHLADLQRRQATAALTATGA